MSELLAFREEARFLTDLWMVIGQPFNAPIIAGGYIRDTVCQKPIRDVDLYINEDDLAEAYRWLFKTSDDCSIGWKDNDTEEYRHQLVRWQQERVAADCIISAYPSMLLKARHINLIAVEGYVSCKGTTDKFNIGLSQFALDKEQQVYFSARAYADWKGQRITVLREQWGADATVKSVEKLQAKYGWPAFFQDDSQYTPEELKRREARSDDDLPY